MVDTKRVDDITGIIEIRRHGHAARRYGFYAWGQRYRPEPGLQKNTRMYSFVRDRGVGGTYLLIEEGKLYATSANQYIRTTQKRDRIDLVERTIQLSNDTDRFCDRNGNVTAVGSPDWADAGWSANIPNPVEACGNCSSSANIQATCIDEDPAGDGTQPPVIYARSRVADLHGRKWITNTSGDDYVDFVTPR